MTPKTFLFDLDGTLTDSGEGIINCAEYALKHFGLPVPSREELRVIVGPPLHESMLKFGVPADRVEEAVNVFRSRYVPIGAYENTPYPGIRELLEKLRSQGHRLYVATSKPEEMAKKILEHFGLASFFTRICGATYDKSRSTKEQVISYLLEETGASGSIVMIGDTEFDVLGAKVHDIPCVCVSWGYGDPAKMDSAGAMAIVHTMDELFDLLNR